MAYLGYILRRSDWPQGQVILLADGKVQLRGMDGRLAGPYTPTGTDRVAKDWQQQ
jgi:hypothetical protein